ncbi:MAG: DUF1028 domain-containing protein [Chloroflexi bacterium]|nr:DUF1028 domain-containing protein [Chloroflexota bacterium]
MSIHTFSIVAHCADENAWGVAVASKFPAVGAVVPWARAGVGAVATQSYAKLSFGPDGLALMDEGLSAADALSRLLEADEERETRQVALVDARGEVAAHTGGECHDWAGHKTGAGFSVQGNLLAGEAVIEALATGFTRAEGELSDRLVAALRAGENAGGDRRGKQSAAVHVARPNGGYGGDNDRYLDLRVDDAAEPVADLAALVKLHHLYFQPPRVEDTLRIDEDIARELQAILIGQGYMTGEVNGVWDEVCQQVFWLLIGNENLEMRWTLEKNRRTIDRVALEYLRQRFG